MDKKNAKINLELANFLILYKHYKDYLLSLGVIIACVLIVLLVVFPQFQQYLSSQEELKVQVEKLQLLKNNYNFLTNLNDAKAASDFNTLSFALPAGKDFAGIMNAISYVSAKTGVSVGDFDFSLGDLSNVTEGVSAFPSVKIDVNLISSPQQIMKFVAELYKTAPVSEVTSTKINGNVGSITILFYYKPFPPQKIDDTVPIVALSGQDLSLVEKISLWNNANSQSLTPVIPSVFSQPTVATASSSEGSSGPF
jgi:Tfp pilus assembly protein PilO